MKRFALMFGVLALATSPVLAAGIIGDVPDVAGPGQVINQRTSAVFADLNTAYLDPATLHGDTLLVGPGSYNIETGVTPYLRQVAGLVVNVIGSGSGADPNLNTIFEGNTPYGGDANNSGQQRFMYLYDGCGTAGSPMTFRDFRVQNVRTGGIYQYNANPMDYTLFDNLAFINMASDDDPYGSGSPTAGWGEGRSRQSDELHGDPELPVRRQQRLRHPVCRNQPDERCHR